jgi:hypothetical protein
VEKDSRTTQSWGSFEVPVFFVGDLLGLGFGLGDLLGDGPLELGLGLGDLVGDLLGLGLLADLVGDGLVELVGLGDVVEVVEELAGVGLVEVLRLAEVLWLAEARRVGLAGARESGTVAASN